MSETTQLPDGIYFDLPAEIYHAQNRLSNTNLCRLLISPGDFWAGSWMNPEPRKDDDTPARILGRAYHCARFEPDQLDQRFVSEIEPDPEVHTLTNDFMIQTELAELGEPKMKKGERVLDRALRLRGCGYSGAIWHLDLAEWEEQRAGRTPINAEIWRQMKRNVRRLHGNPEVAAYFEGGKSEVTILWTDEATGLQFKARFDFLKPGQVIDFKTFENPQGKNIYQCISDAFRFRRYYVQALLYWKACELIREGKVADEYDPDHQWTDSQVDLIADIEARQTPLDVTFIWQQKGDVPNIFVRKIKLFAPHESHRHNRGGADEDVADSVEEKTMKPTRLHIKANFEIRRAIETYQQCMDVFGPDQPWLALDYIGATTDDDFSSWWLDH